MTRVDQGFTGIEEAWLAVFAQAVGPRFWTAVDEKSHAFVVVRALQTAIDLNPSYATAQYPLVWVALQPGEKELCLDRVGFARRLSPSDPLEFAMLGVYALNLAMMGRTEEAAELSSQSTLRPNAH